MSRPKISIITVCFNNEQTVERTLKSVDEQDWPDIEHMIIDGASTDQTLNILARYDKAGRSVLSEPDKGIYEAMNKGLARASGDIICFLNADDIYASRTTLSQVAELFQQQSLDAVIGDVAFFRQENPEKNIRHYRSANFTPEKLAWGMMPAHPALFLTRQTTNRIGKFNTTYKIAGDYDYIIRCFHNQTVSFVHLPQILVRMQAGGISNKNLQARFLLNKEVLRACRENGIRTNWLKILSRYPKKILEMIQV